MRIANLAYYALPSRMDALLFGSLLALLKRGVEWRILSVYRSVLLVLGTSPLLALLLWEYRAGFPLTPAITNPFLIAFESTSIALASAAVIVTLTHDDDVLSRMLRWRPLMLLGTISYGAYVFHDIAQDHFVACLRRLLTTRHLQGTPIRER